MHFLGQAGQHPAARETMLRITKLDENPASVRFRLEGRLASDWVAELERECRGALARRQYVELDFEAVHFVDRRALRFLERFTPQHLRIVNCPTLIRELLDHDHEK